MFRIAICEDNQQQMEVLLALIGKYKTIRSGLEVSAHSFGSGLELLEEMDSGKEFDLFLLDILMPRLSGIELARELRLRGEDAPLVFLTSSTYHALDAFGVHATQYILKPIKDKDLFPVLDKIIATADRGEGKHLLVSTPVRKVKVPFSSIVCVESISRTLRVYLSDGTSLDSKTIRVPFSAAVAPLLQDSRFLHAHNSFVLNMDMVKELSGSWFLMKDGMEVPVPKYKYKDAKTKYLEHLAACGTDLLGV